MELKITETQKNSIGANKYVGANKNTVTSITTTTTTPNKKSINYDDILSKMSMCVVDGKLQISNKDLENVKTNATNAKITPNMTQKNNTKQVQLNATNINNVNNNNNDSNTIMNENAKVPIKLTELQYKQLVFLNQMKRQQEINRLNELKPKKLLFSMNDVKIKTNVNPNMNRLFGFVGKQ